MNLKFYRQGEVTLKSGLTIYTGEDALPYVDDRLLIVADGLGGTGAIRHSAIVEEMFDRETALTRATAKCRTMLCTSVQWAAAQGFICLSETAYLMTVLSVW